eukprot:363446-Chlamydomonas_euryale.AAC.16
MWRVALLGHHQSMRRVPQAAAPLSELRQSRDSVFVCLGVGLADWPGLLSHAETCYQWFCPSPLMARPATEPLAGQPLLSPATKALEQAFGRPTTTQSSNKTAAGPLRRNLIEGWINVPMGNYFRKNYKAVRVCSPVFVFGFSKTYMEMTCYKYTVWCIPANRWNDDDSLNWHELFDLGRDPYELNNKSPGVRSMTGVKISARCQPRVCGGEGGMNGLEVNFIMTEVKDLSTE